MDFLSSLQVALDGYAFPTTSLLIATQGKAPIEVPIVIVGGGGRVRRPIRDLDEEEERRVLIDDDELLILL